MELVRLELAGKFAHFRKYYSNNTALSYLIPPRTTIMGMLASMLGSEKDTYYEAMAPDQLRIGVGLQSAAKKSFHRLNMLSIKGPGDFRGKGGRVQTPFEVITPADLHTGSVAYTLYISPVKAESDIFESIKTLGTNRSPHFCLSLGTANFQASLRSVFVPSTVTVLQAAQLPLWLHSAVPSSQVSGLHWETDRPLNLEEELLPVAFERNHDRTVAQMNRVLYATDGRPLPVVYSGTYYRFSMGDEEIDFTFMD